MLFEENKLLVRTYFIIYILNIITLTSSSQRMYHGDPLLQVIPHHISRLSKVYQDFPAQLVLITILWPFSFPQKI